MVVGTDTWASRNLLSLQAFEELGGEVKGLRKNRVMLRGINGHHIENLGVTSLILRTADQEGQWRLPIITEAFVIPQLYLNGIEMLLGDPGLRQLTKDRVLQISYNGLEANANVVGAVGEREVIDMIEDTDCVIRKYQSPPESDSKYYWEYAWKWIDDPPDRNLSAPRRYRKRLDAEMVEKAVEEWATGVLEECPDPEFLISINPVAQEKKKNHKIRVCGDCVPLNAYIRNDPTTTSNEVCAEAIRRMRAVDQGVFLDLSKAYQSVSLDPTLRKYNAFQIGGKWLQAKKMLFGICIGQKVLKLILDRVLEDRTINFRDDLLIPDSDQEQAIYEILRENGFRIKEGAWRLQDLSADNSKPLLGLQLSRMKSQLVWKREVIEPREIITCRDLAQGVGELGSSHLPCLGHTRAEMAILRSLLGKYIGSDVSRWTHPVPEELRDLFELSVKDQNRQAYRWRIEDKRHDPRVTYRLYCDASGLLTGGIIRTVRDGVESDDIEDFCSLNRCEAAHINIAELNGVVYGLQHMEEYAPTMARIEIITDSKTCRAWVQTAIEDGIVRTKALNKSLVKTRVAIIHEMIQQNAWEVTVSWVGTKDNPADVLTRVNSTYMSVWRRYTTAEENELEAEHEQEIVGVVEATAPVMTDQELRRLHEYRLHPGANCMIKILPQISATQIRKIVSNCLLCRRKRPAQKYVNLKSAHPTPTRPWEWIQMDCLALNSSTKVVLLIDEYSRWIEARVVRGVVKHDHVIGLLEEWCARHQPGCFHLRTDRGTEFNNAYLRVWLRQRGGVQHLGSTRRPTAQGIVERANRSLLSLARIAKALAESHAVDKDDPVPYFRRALSEYWNRPHRGLKWLTPNQALRSAAMNWDSTSETSELESLHDSSDSGTESEHEENSRNEAGSQEGEELQWSSPMQSPQNERLETAEDAPNQQVLAYIPSQEKLEFDWMPAKVIREGMNGTKVIQANNRRPMTLNQRWLQPLPEGNEGVSSDPLLPEEQPKIAEPPLRRSKRTQKPRRLDM